MSNCNYFVGLLIGFKFAFVYVRTKALSDKVFHTTFLFLPQVALHYLKKSISLYIISSVSEVVYQMLPKYMCLNKSQNKAKINSIYLTFT